MIARRLSVLACCAVLGGCDNRKPAPLLPRPVVSMRVDPSSAMSPGTFPGTVQARYNTTLAFQIGGRVLARHAEVGDKVAKGTQLAELDSTDQRLEMVAAEADVANAAAQLTNTQNKFERTRELVARHDSPQADLDLATADRDAAVARLDSTRAQLVKARETLSYTALIAVFDGVVTAWDTEAGQQIEAGQAAMTMARPDVLEVAVDVATDMLADVSVGTNFSVTLQTDPRVATTATLRERGPMADASTRTQRLLLAIPAPPEAFHIGTTVTVVMSRSARLHLSLPASALLEHDGQAFVWIVQDGKVQQREVTVLSRSEGKVTVVSDISEGMSVVTAGVHSLTPGQPVRLATR